MTVLVLQIKFIKISSNFIFLNTKVKGVRIWCLHGKGLSTLQPFLNFLILTNRVFNRVLFLKVKNVTGFCRSITMTKLQMMDRGGILNGTFGIADII